MNARSMVISVLLGLSLVAGGVMAEQNVQAPRPAHDSVDSIKRPVEWFLWGADVRLRNDSAENPSLQNADPPGHSYSFERLRIRESNTISLTRALDFNLRFAWEGRHYWAPASKDTWEPSEIVFDNLNATVSLTELPATLVVGRQDLVFGEGWLVSDGTPLDGPRTSFFDAIRTTLVLQPVKSSLDLVYIDQSANPNSRLRPIFSKSKPLMEQDERGAIIHFTGKPTERLQVDAYGVYKHDEAVTDKGDNGDVYTSGGCLILDLNRSTALRVEGAYQFGHRANAAMLPNRDSTLSAWGNNGRLTYAFRDPRVSQLSLGYEVFSGNDARDTHNHQFDPLWGRWARYSELFPNDFDRPSDRSNVVRVSLGYQVEPIRGMQVQLNNHAVFAYANPNSGVRGFSDSGRLKGQIFTVLLKQTFYRFWTGKVLFEYFHPGNYYAIPPDAGPLSSRGSPATFLRVETLFVF